MPVDVRPATLLINCGRALISLTTGFLRDFLIVLQPKTPPKDALLMVSSQGVAGSM
jgi:hypothetical protein